MRPDDEVRDEVRQPPLLATVQRFHQRLVSALASSVRSMRCAKGCVSCLKTANILVKVRKLAT
jgi:hypothetical protein